MAPTNTQYVPLRQYDISEGRPFDAPAGADGYSSLRQEVKFKTVNRAIRRWEWLARGVLVLLSAFFFTLWITAIMMRKCTYVAKYSPANEAIEYVDGVKYKGALHFTTPWRGNESGNPSSNVDAAWRRISTDVKPICVTEEQMHKMGMAVTSMTVKIPGEQGGRYLVSLEVTHHLQCLDMLRKATYRSYYESFDPAFQVEDETLMNRLDTCVELLRQALMCYPDLNMVAYYWVRGRRGPISNSNTIHRCKNFDKILDWAAREAVDTCTLPSFNMEVEDGSVSGGM